MTCVCFLETLNLIVYINYSNLMKCTIIFLSSSPYFYLNFLFPISIISVGMTKFIFLCLVDLDSNSFKYALFFN